MNRISKTTVDDLTTLFTDLSTNYTPLGPMIAPADKGNLMALTSLERVCITPVAELVKNHPYLVLATSKYTRTVPASSTLFFSVMIRICRVRNEDYETVNAGDVRVVSIPSSEELHHFGQQVTHRNQCLWSDLLPYALQPIEEWIRLPAPDSLIPLKHSARYLQCDKFCNFTFYN